MKPANLLLAFAAALLLFAGCGTNRKKMGPKFDAYTNKVAFATNFTTVERTNALNPAWLKAPTNFFTLGPGDKIEIEVLNEAGTRAIATVGPDGKIYYHLLNGIDVWGLTLAETQEKLRGELTKYVVDPQVGVQLRGIDSKRIWMLGRVQKAGVYPMGVPMTLLESISAAGGTLVNSESGTTEDLADLSHGFVIRNGERLPIDFEALLKSGDMSQNIYLEPDDFVYFPSAATSDIYVFGAVRAPKAVRRNHGTLAAAISAAGGPIKDAFISNVAIVRGSLSNPQIAIVDFRDIQKGKARDIVLEPRDIVYVPFSPYRYISKYVDLILTTFVRAVAINEGARAASGAVQPAGVSIGVVNFPAAQPVMTAPR